MTDDKTVLTRQQFRDRLAKAHSPEELDQLRVEFLGKKGAVSSLMGMLRSVLPENKKAFGQSVNDLKQEIEDQLKKLGLMK